MRQNRSDWRGLGFLVAMAVACCCICVRVASAQTYTVLHSFSSSDGANPKARLIQASDGYLYGTTSLGGDGNLGTVFRMDTSGNLTTLHSFDGVDGANPVAGLIEAADGFLYGTTWLGGNHQAGTLFRIDTSGNLTTLHHFGSTCPPAPGLPCQPAGAYPIADLVEGDDGLLYGTTKKGGTSAHCNGGCGTIFRTDTAGNLTTLYSFINGPDGAYPAAGLIQASDSNLYGTTDGDSESGLGSIFRIDLSGQLTVLQSFTGFNGAHPLATLVEGSNGDLYGTTSYGPFPDEGGTVFRVSTSGNLSVLHSFSVPDGIRPKAGLVLASTGDFYGTTSEGGSGSGFGTIFRIDASGTLAMVHAFSGDDGSQPVAGLVQASDGKLYGTTTYGGASGQGVVFRLEYCTVNPPPIITPSGPTTFCEGGSVTLDAGAGYSSYLWSPFGETAQTILVTVGGTFGVTVTDAAGCKTAAPYVDVDVVSNPTPVITANRCAPPNTSGLTASVPFVIGDSYSWTITGATIDSGQGTPQIQFSSGDPGSTITLSVQQSRPPGCNGTAAATLQVVDPSPVIDVVPCLTPRTSGFEASVPLAAGATYSWTITGGTIDSGQGTNVIGFTTGGPGTRMKLSIEETIDPGCDWIDLKTMQVDFSDVPPENLFHASVCTIGRDGVTAGHPDGSYGVAADVTRAQMAVFLLKAKHGSAYAPPSCIGIFADVGCSPTPAFAVDWIEQLYVEGVTAGCAAEPVLRYCPDEPVSRAQMAVLLLKAAHVPGFTPPSCTGIFQDVPCSPDPAIAVDWIEELYNEGVTAGCQSAPLQFCPHSSVKRGPMAAFLVGAFGLQ